MKHLVFCPQNEKHNSQFSALHESPVSFSIHERMCSLQWLVDTMLTGLVFFVDQSHYDVTWFRNKVVPVVSQSSFCIWNKICYTVGCRSAHSYQSRFSEIYMSLMFVLWTSFPNSLYLIGGQLGSTVFHKLRFKELDYTFQKRRKKNKKTYPQPSSRRANEDALRQNTYLCC